MLTRRTLLFLGMLLAYWVPPLAAQEYPNKLIRIVVPYPPGASLDMLARAVA